MREQVLVHHPLQPFDVRNLVPGALTVRGRPFSFDRAALEGARAARGERTEPGAFVAEPLADRRSDDVSLVDLRAFLAHPVRAFLRSRLDLTAPLEAEQTRDAIPLTLDGLDKWKVGDRMLADLLAGQSPADVVRTERLRGELPPGPLGGRALQEVVDRLKGLLAATAPLREGEPRSVDVDVDLGSGRRLTGTVAGVVGHRRVSVSYSTLAAKHRLVSWLDLLALTVGHPDAHWTGHALGRARSATAHAAIGPLDHRAEQWLRDLVDLYDRGMREPLPLPVKTACAYAEAAQSLARGGRSTPRWAAEREWRTDRFATSGIPGEDADPAHVQVFGEHAPVECLMAPPRRDEHWNAESHRLGQLAVRLWQPLLDGAEQVSHL